MERSLFEEKYNKAASYIDEEKLNKATHRFDENPLYIGCPGTRNLVITMEEIAELQTELFKFFIGEGDHLSLIEETADVYLAFRWIKNICKISNEEVSKKMKGEYVINSKLVIMKSLSELQQQISKFLRGKGNHDVFVEKLANGYRSLEWIQNWYYISEENVNKAMNVKIERVLNREDVPK